MCLFKNWSRGHGNPFHSWCHYIQRSIYRGACRRSWKWRKFPSRVSWHHSFYWRVCRIFQREKKEERHLWRLGRVGCTSVHWRRCSPLRVWLWWKTGSHRLDLPFFQKEPQEEPWMKFDDASKWHEANLTVTKCASVFSSPSRDGLKSLLYHLP